MSADNEEVTSTTNSHHVFHSTLFLHLYIVNRFQEMLRVTNNQFDSNFFT